MKSHRFTQVSVIVLFTCVFAFAGVRSTRRTRGQNKPNAQSNGLAAGGGTVADSLKAATGADSKASGFVAFAAAAVQNEQLKNSLPWSFGGKSQRGWSLYVPLISNLIGSDSNPAGNPFAARLALWQKENSAEPNGILDSGTWSRMVSAFQSRRLAGRPYPSPDQLITIPTADCYDPTRAEELRKAERETFAAYKRMVAAAANDSSLGLQITSNGDLAPSEKFFKIVSAFRSREYQDQLRRQSPNSGRAGLAINSPHQTGRALDIYVGGEPVNTKDENRAIQIRTPVYQWLVANAARFGFRPYFYEPWHWEYVGVGNVSAK